MNLPLISTIPSAIRLSFSKFRTGKRAAIDQDSIILYDATDDNLIPLLNFWKISLDTAKRLFSPNRLFARLKTPGMKVKNAMLCQSICVPFLSFIDSELFILREMSFPSMSVSHMKLIAHYCALTLKSCVLELIWEFEIILSRIVWIHNHSNSRQFIWINLYFDSILLW